MTEPNERSDPVDGHTEVTLYQLDALHANCDRWNCSGAEKARERRLAAKAIADGQTLRTDVAERLGRITAAMEDVGNALAVATRWTARVSGEHEEPLADWQRELLAAVERERQADLHREALQAGLQHQRIGNIAIW